MLGYLYWFLIDIMKPFNDEKLNNNFIDFSHTLVCIPLATLSYYYDHTIMSYIFYNFSRSFFVWDSVKIILNNNKSYLYIVHHLATVLLLDKIYYDNHKIFQELFIIAELSNISIYTTYHLIKTNCSNNIYYCKLFQILWYGYLRIYIFTRYYSQYLFIYDFDILMKLSLFIYIMGIYWWSLQISKFINEYNIVPLLRDKFDSMNNFIRLRLLTNDGEKEEPSPHTD